VTVFSTSAKALKENITMSQNIAVDPIKEVMELKKSLPKGATPDNEIKAIKKKAEEKHIP